MADSILVNGNVHSWGSIIAKVDGERFYGFTSISYGDKRKRVKLWGMGRHHSPRGRSSGKYEVDPVKLGGPKSSCHALRGKLAAKASDGASYGNSEFQIEIQTVEFDETPLTVSIERCVIDEDASSHEESADPLEDELSIDAMRIYRNGLTLFDGTVSGGL